MTAAGSGAAEVRDAYVRALRDGDRREAFRLIDEARAAGLDLGTIYMDVFQPALREVGRLWQENALTVADEHLATAITQAAMARVYEQAATWDGHARRTLVAACVDTERHEVGLRMLCDLLECAGWDTTYLGATVPVDSLVMMLRRRRPDVLALSAALPPHLPRLRDTIRAVRLAMHDAPPLVLVGGRPFLEDPALAARLGADLTAADATTAVRLLNERLAPPTAASDAA
ncbi:Methionine synthase B12-binding module cap domain protein [Gemmatirosa kalamazoonensis]|uniref:Methionine synthase B12-binding module cap domain protein n=1 Tax=Gemmatirosa kalamazoonensis TaxID=861299 RepID=W0REJ7_9BACT|nr:B12-binding domain-containing protein [Gemmatirosa kalamazoonensis]AHG87803.1 Methionine synthase B12-binding module cap domain protein [Gemmatirosa kalamazoonensis]